MVKDKYKISNKRRTLEYEDFVAACTNYYISSNVIYLYYDDGTSAPVFIPFLKYLIDAYNTNGFNLKDINEYKVLNDASKKKYDYIFKLVERNVLQ